MKYMYYCPKCKKMYSRDYGNHTPAEKLKCYKCENDIYLACEEMEYRDAEYNMTPENFNNFIQNLIKDHVNEYEEIQKNDELYNERLNNIIVTTADLHEEYEIVGPDYYQINNAGSGKVLRQLISNYEREINDWKAQGLSSNDKYNWLESLGDIAYLFGSGDRDLTGNSHAIFDIAFYISLQELKKRALIMEADAIVGMKQDLDLDTNGFQHFYLQMYGTAVRRKNNQVQL